MRRILHLYSRPFRAEYTTEASHFSPTHLHCCRSQSTLLQVNMKHAGLMKSCAMRRKNDWHCDANHGVFRMRVCLCVCAEPTLGEGWRRHILSCLVCRYVTSGFNPSSSSLYSYHIKDTVMTSVTSLSHNSRVLYQPDLHLNAASLNSFSSPWNETRLC